MSRRLDDSKGFLKVWERPINMGHVGYEKYWINTKIILPNSLLSSSFFNSVIFLLHFYNHSIVKVSPLLEDFLKWERK